MREHGTSQRDNVVRAAEEREEQWKLLGDRAGSTREGVPVRGPGEGCCAKPTERGPETGKLKYRV